MGLAKAFAPIEAKYKAEVMADTWGHLAPEPGRKYPGHMYFTQSEYRDLISIRSDFGDLPGSPWFFDDQQDFIGMKAVEEGVVYKFTGYYIKFKSGSYRFTGEVREVKLQ